MSTRIFDGTYFENLDSVSGPVARAHVLLMQKWFEKSKLNNDEHPFNNVREVWITNTHDENTNPEFGKGYSGVDFVFYPELLLPVMAGLFHVEFPFTYALGSITVSGENNRHLHIDNTNQNKIVYETPSQKTGKQTWFDMDSDLLDKVLSFYGWTAVYRTIYPTEFNAMLSNFRNSGASVEEKKRRATEPNPEPMWMEKLETYLKWGAGIFVAVKIMEFLKNN
jgi:hypothetical protein